jgi:hypothetical protein
VIESAAHGMIHAANFSHSLSLCFERGHVDCIMHGVSSGVQNSTVFASFRTHSLLPEGLLYT